MSGADDVWRSKSDDELAEAAERLSEYTEEGERIIRAELRRRGMAEPASTERPIDESSTTSPVVHRYRDAYRVGRALVALGNGIKRVGAILGPLIVVLAASSGNGQLSFVLGGGVIAVVVGGLFWVCGVLVAAQGQILEATLDNAVASSHFLTDGERADAMSLPREVIQTRGLNGREDR
ncbi:MAG: hypothetical protein ACRD2N_05515 [Vicinamibacterales bacterium]